MISLLLLVFLLGFSESEICDITEQKDVNMKFRAALKTFLPVPKNSPVLGWAPRIPRAERRERFKVFKAFKHIVDEVNHNTNLPFTTEINPFSIELNTDRFFGLNETKVSEDMLTDYEVESTTLDGEESNDEDDERRQKRSNDLPSYVNWTDTLSTPIHQQECGSCWAFSAAATMESAYYRTMGTKISFSMQEIVDCALERYRFDPCKGSTISTGILWAATKKRLASSVDYPYVGKQTPCRASETPNSLTNVKARRLLRVPRDDLSLTEAVTEGVLSVGIYAGTSLLAYKTGIYYDPKTCRATSFPNHAVNLVGYGQEGECGGTGRKYWILRNSWGEKWGEGGYFRMSRDHVNTCKINESALRLDLRCLDEEKCKKQKADSD